ncbi:hypothetical protein CEXT_208681 [Caerostris extrusa]|uniref:Uncharacterized protein n=1 Tax=Caerostris extrusa TaxID=172846 RepID=A0AAV4TFE8_CAEEX|nr:hypothetical protein CEXT_208681 [Caerostris extrusa]
MCKTSLRNFVVYRSRFSDGLAFYQAVLEWLSRSSIPETKLVLILLVMIRRIRTIQKLKAISDEYFETFWNDVDTIGGNKNMDSLPDFISENKEGSINFNKKIKMSCRCIPQDN